MHQLKCAAGSFDQLGPDFPHCSFSFSSAACTAAFVYARQTRQSRILRRLALRSCSTESSSAPRHHRMCASLLVDHWGCLSSNPQLRLRISTAVSTASLAYWVHSVMPAPTAEPQAAKNSAIARSPSLCMSRSLAFAASARSLHPAPRGGRSRCYRIRLESPKDGPLRPPPAAVPAADGPCVPMPPGFAVSGSTHAHAPPGLLGLQTRCAPHLWQPHAASRKRFWKTNSGSGYYNRADDFWFQADDRTGCGCADAGLAASSKVNAGAIALSHSSDGKPRQRLRAIRASVSVSRSSSASLDRGSTRSDIGSANRAKAARDNVSAKSWVAKR
jgi:hypothetical protein